MNRQALKITLLDDVVLSQRNATSGGHETLDYIPGQALLGIAASRLYPKLSLPAARQLFHSGQLRFGNGLPARGNGETAERGWPMPLAWHQAKGDSQNGADRLQADRVYNMVHASAIPDPENPKHHLQPEQLRQGYVFADGSLVRPARNQRLKTAITPGEGRAAEGQLFGYEALCAGQSFIAEIEADEDIDQTHFQSVIDALTGERLLGRSRSAEYGRVRIEPVSLPGPETGRAEKTLTLWLLSDLAPVDIHGQPTLALDPAALGIGPGRLLAEQSFLRTRRYSPWNARRRGPDSERVVYQQGGVIRFELDQAPDQDTLTRLAAGIGLHREGGLGKVAVQPSLLASDHPQFASPAEAADHPGQARPERPQSALIAWLEDRRQDEQVTDLGRDQLDALIRDWRAALNSARSLQGVPGDKNFGPSAAQWGRVMELANQSDQADELMERLFQGNSAIIKAGAEGWQEQVASDGEMLPLATRLKALLEQARENAASERAFIRVVRQFAHQCQADGSGRSTQ